MVQIVNCFFSVWLCVCISLLLQNEPMKYNDNRVANETVKQVQNRFTHWKENKVEEESAAAKAAIAKTQTKIPDMPVIKQRKMSRLKVSAKIWNNTERDRERDRIRYIFSICF